jgi:hypothetical protein
MPTPDPDSSPNRIMRYSVCPGFFSSLLEVMVDDAVILISMLLQHGYRVDELFAKLMRADTGTAADRFADEATGARKPSLLAAILGGAIKIELEEGDAMAAAYAARGNQS